jgi:hypothetical protein
MENMHKGKSFAEKRLIFQQGPSQQPAQQPAEDPLQEIDTHIGNLTSETEAERQEALDAIRNQCEALKGNISIGKKEELVGMLAEAEKQLETQGDMEDSEYLAILGKEIEEFDSSQQEPPENQPAEEKTDVVPPNQSQVAKKVSDIAQPGSESEEGFTGRIKGLFKGLSSGAIGGLVGAYISIYKKWIEFFPPKDPELAKKRLEGIEKMHDEWFGVSETQEIARNVIKENGMKLDIVDGTKDKSARASLRVKWRQILNEKLNGQTDLELKAAIEEENTIEKFVSDEVEKYLKEHTGEFVVDKRYATTLTGITKNEKPVERTSEQVAATSQQNKSGGISSLFSFWS